MVDRRTSRASVPGQVDAIKKRAAADRVAMGINRTGDAPAAKGLNRMAQSAVVRTTPKVYSPLFEMTNLMLPRDQKTLNAWCRHFYEVNPWVRNAINLHATYPISKFKIACADQKVKRFFEGMLEDLNFMQILTGISLEYWKLGEAFVYAELDESNGKWKRIFTHNPDYISVKANVLSQEPMISIQPDDVLKRLIQSNKPEDRKLSAQIPKEIKYYVQRGENIPLNNFNISHLKLLSSPYDVRGTSIIVSCFKDLMLYDKLLEMKVAQADNMINPITLVKLGDPTGCYSADTEILTENGFKKYDEVQDDEKLATFNDETKKMEYQNFTDRFVYSHHKEMIHFKSKAMDMLVTPDHNMYASEWIYKTDFTWKELGESAVKICKDTRYTPWHLLKAKDVQEQTRFRTVVEWKGKDKPFIKVGNHEIDTMLLAKFAGYFVSEGWTTFREGNRCTTSIGQKQGEATSFKIKDIFEQIGQTLNLKLHHYVEKTKWSKLVARNQNTGIDSIKSTIMDRYHIYNQELTEFLCNNFGSGALYKYLPKWLKDLSPKYLEAFLECAIEGDGHRANKDNFAYYTASKQLADDIQEVAMKIGYVTQLSKSRVGWTVYGHGQLNKCNNKVGKNGQFPLVYSRVGEAKTTVPYEGNVWCFAVPNKLLITRRNGQIAVQGNTWRPSTEDIKAFQNIMEEAQYDPDFKIITHGAVAIEKIGSGTGRVDVATDMERLQKNVLIGLFVPQGIFDSDGPTYASASVGLEVLQDRYLSFRSLIEKWIEQKIFAPLSRLNGFYETKDGGKKLIVPHVVWDKINLKRTSDYISTVVGMASPEGGVSKESVFNILDLDYTDEYNKRRKEMINDVIMEKEKEILSKKSVEELRAMDPTKPIKDDAVPTQPGEITPEEPDLLGDLGGEGPEKGGASKSAPMGGGAPSKMPKMPPPPTSTAKPAGGAGGAPGGSTGGAPQTTPSKPAPKAP